jgi:hypothetical protein
LFWSKLKYDVGLADYVDDTDNVIYRL